MKILRSVNRRGFSVGTAGWFTVLRPNTWFPASRFPVSHSLGRGTALPGHVSSGHSDMQKTSTLSQPLELSPTGLRMGRSISIIAGAFGITSILLWWIMQP